ncbi:MAG: M15 family metallopeptidase, partial [Myxococcota bacterium]|nr:M15 family metallopeptidase [Myxococcota bacterium]
GVDKRLAAVRDALAGLPRAQRRYFETTAGTFNWRKIRDTPRLSMHSFAVAIDVGVPYADYWKWSKRRNADGAIVYRNRFPMSVVTAFEAQGFIWGGKWYHHDTMHFEYRPELLHPLCAN